MGFLWAVFSWIRKESTILSLYEEIRVREKQTLVVPVFGKLNGQKISDHTTSIFFRLFSTNITRSIPEYCVPNMLNMQNNISKVRQIFSGISSI